MHPTDRFLAACRREPVDRPPIWIMRQAGRYMSSYRALRERANFMEICRVPANSLEATMMAVDQLGVDAAILFSDILVPLEPMGMTVEFDEGGPKVSKVRDAATIAALRTDVADDLGFVYEAVSLIKSTLRSRSPDATLPLLGFSGSPFTLATYAVEGGTTKNKHALRKLIWDAPELLHQLLAKMTEVVAPYCIRQIEAGADAIQLFDTWGGLLTESEWRTFSQPYTSEVLRRIRAAKPATPLIHYALEASHLVPAMAELPCDVLSVDWREPLSSVRARTGHRFAHQGNVEPGVMTCSSAAIARAVTACMDDFGRLPGHIVNLGHGITPDASVEAARTFVAVAREHGHALWSGAQP
ncbi:MAG: uroporphyrinogen decarboxylase [Deltaproteobacteria bacterium]|nr:uroporphyrinogen decarboxylase [Deltaproteobacteria bacterium]